MFWYLRLFVQRKAGIRLIHIMVQPKSAKMFEVSVYCGCSWFQMVVLLLLVKRYKSYGGGGGKGMGERKRGERWLRDSDHFWA